MSATPSWTIHCDGCGAGDGGDPGGARTAEERRLDLSRREPDPDRRWSVNGPGGTDWCGACRANGTMRSALKRRAVQRKTRVTIP